jgi:hypothetical protein
VKSSNHTTNEDVQHSTDRGYGFVVTNACKGDLHEPQAAARAHRAPANRRALSLANARAMFCRRWYACGLASQYACPCTSRSPPRHMFLAPRTARWALGKLDWATAHVHVQQEINIMHVIIQSTTLSSRLLPKKIKIRRHKTLILPAVLDGCETWSLTLREEHRLRE